MDTLLFSSDLHGSSSKLTTLLEKANTFQAKTLLLAGDTCPSEGSTFSEILRTSIVPIVMVRGNCDTQYAFHATGLTLPPLIRRFPFSGRTIIMIHGDRYFSPEELGLRPQDIVLSGHTHCPSLTIGGDGVIYVNPGSPSYPRSSYGETYGIIENGKIEIRSLATDIPLPDLQYYFMPLI
ncbi:putative phosphoesterase [Sphaerochaeta pleomorpha str. Grapes]|uniref:Putative phosphoesterase n=1 Tax=Sphaerochaeta pleomorpha (strain ATCC BAA-1885 / DSM 22778 / Grapes) TaxID=158190 RepID=G8QRY0_SPHPG|nr:metallophosphoesterase family protein [Sphaerochaeta pleomorpha]AEV29978.1 putative phosphoesterase [Sphaerochaeta pleomorpha str. Grapes]